MEFQALADSDAAKFKQPHDNKFNLKFSEGGWRSHTPTGLPSLSDAIAHLTF